MIGLLGFGFLSETSLQSPSYITIRYVALISNLRQTLIRHIGFKNSRMAPPLFYRPPTQLFNFLQKACKKLKSSLDSATIDRGSEKTP